VFQVVVMVRHVMNALIIVLAETISAI
jgi:hypothetical protein